MAIIERIKAGIATLKSTGFFSIAVASVVNRFLLALLSILVVRILTKAEYGVYTYAMSIINFFVIFNGLGATSAILQICSEQFENLPKAQAVLRYSERFGIGAEAVLTIVLLLVALFAPLTIAGSNAVMLWGILLPLSMLLCDMRLTWLRARMENHRYGLLLGVQAACVVIFALLGTLVFQACGLIVGQTIGYFVSYGIVCALARTTQSENTGELSSGERHDIRSIATISAVNNGLSQGLTILGVFMVGLLLASDDEVADYSVATTIPFALLFLPSIIVTYIYPHFALHKDDRSWTLRSYGRVTALTAVAMLIVTIIFWVFGRPIIVFLFSERYGDITATFNVLLIGFFITATLRTIVGNLLVSQRRLAFNTLQSALSIALCALLNWLFIPMWGPIGAAWAWTLTMTFGAVISVPYYLIVAGRPSLSDRSSKDADA